MGSGLPGSPPLYLLYHLLLYISHLANKIIVVVVVWSSLPPTVRRCRKSKVVSYLLADRPKKPQAPLRRLRLLRKVNDTFLLRKTLALRYGILENTRVHESGPSMVASVWAQYQIFKENCAQYYWNYISILKKSITYPDNVDIRIYIRGRRETSSVGHTVVTDIRSRLSVSKVEAVQQVWGPVGWKPTHNWRKLNVCYVYFNAAHSSWF